MRRHRLKRCRLCGERIPADRLLALPGVATCAGCSTERKVTAADVDLDGADRDDVVKSAQDGGCDND